jgi:hypothetical protein
MKPMVVAMSIAMVLYFLQMAEPSTGSSAAGLAASAVPQFMVRWSGKDLCARCLYNAALQKPPALAAEEGR